MACVFNDLAVQITLHLAEHDGKPPTHLNSELYEEA